MEAGSMPHLSCNNVNDINILVNSESSSSCDSFNRASHPLEIK